MTREILACLDDFFHEWWVSGRLLIIVWVGTTLYKAIREMHNNLTYICGLQAELRSVWSEADGLFHCSY